MNTAKRSILSLAAMALATGIILAPVAPAQAAHGSTLGFGFFIGGPGVVHHAHARRSVLTRGAIKQSLRRQGYRHIRNLRYTARSSFRARWRRSFRGRRGVYIARARDRRGHTYRVFVSPYNGRVLRRVHI